MTKILVTGAGGFAGHHFFEHILSETNWHNATEMTPKGI